MSNTARIGDYIKPSKTAKMRFAAWQQPEYIVEDICDKLNAPVITNDVGNEVVIRDYEITGNSDDRELATEIDPRTLDFALRIPNGYPAWIDDLELFKVGEPPTSDYEWSTDDAETTAGFKYDSDKPRMDLLPAWAQRKVAEILTFGADKYDPDNRVSSNNWRQGMRHNRVLASLLRHLNAWQDGEDYDPESGKLHLAHMAANALMLLEYQHIYPQGDDRAIHALYKPRVGLDVDGVICDTYPEVTKRCGIAKGPYAKDMPHYAYGETHMDALDGLTRKDWLWLNPMIDGTDLPFEPVVYVTARKGEAFNVLPEWLEMNGFPYAPVVSCEDKAKVLKSYDVDVFVEDKFETFRHLTKEGIFCYLLDQPYNRKHDVGARRIKSLKEVIKR